MILLKTAADLLQWRNNERVRGRKVGFVPTMGALHQGHIHLIQTALGNGDSAVCSIFVNPAQFNDISDFEKYPVSTESDIAALEKAGCTLLFLPAVSEIYPADWVKQHYPLGSLESTGEGEFRPGHFQGVCQVMDRLLSIVRPDQLYMGQKDFQQCLVVQALIAFRGFTVQFHAVPTVREPDGLAMSSRNRRLGPEQRPQAAAIAATLTWVKNTVSPGPVDGITTEGMRRLEKAGLRPEYLSISRASDGGPVDSWDGREKIVVLAAAFLGDVRLIDNMLIN